MGFCRLLRGNDLGQPASLWEVRSILLEHAGWTSRIHSPDVIDRAATQLGHTHIRQAIQP
jgi:hypothetical protein